MTNYIAIAIATASLITNVTLGRPETELISAKIHTDKTPPPERITAVTAQNPIQLETKKSSRSVKRVTYLTVTAYSSRPEETDDTPFITASGSYVSDGLVATNALPMKTMIRIPAYFGDKVFRVEDRMHSRYNDRLDVWFNDTAEAKAFGLKKSVKIEIL